MAAINVGDHVRYHSYAWGWRFGRVIGRHRNDMGVFPDGAEMATVRFAPCAARKDIEDHAIPCGRLEVCEGRYPLYLEHLEGGATFFA